MQQVVKGGVLTDNERRLRACRPVYVVDLRAYWQVSAVGMLRSYAMDGLSPPVYFNSWIIRRLRHRATPAGSRLGPFRALVLARLGAPLCPCRWPSVRLHGSACELTRSSHVPPRPPGSHPSSSPRSLRRGSSWRCPCAPAPTQSRRSAAPT